MTGLHFVVAAAVLVSDCGRTAQPAPSVQAGSTVLPRTPDGQPDVQGFWNVVRKSDDPNKAPIFPSYALEGGESVTAVNEDEGKLRLSSAVPDPPDGKIPYRPRAAEHRKRFQGEAESVYDPLARCVSGVPRGMYLTGFQLIQPSGAVVIVPEFNHLYRIISLDRRPPREANLNLITGTSAGHWEEDTLVVDTINNSNLAWFDNFGSFHSSALRVVERFAFVDADTIHYEATMNDPSLFTRPWTIAVTMRRDKQKDKDYEIWEFACHENERDVEHIVKGATVRR